MRKAELDDQGKLNLGPVGGARTGAINVAFDSNDTSGIALNVEASPAAGNARAAIKLGAFVVGQDPDANGATGFGIVGADGEDSTLRTVTYTLTASDLGGLGVFELIPAPDADKVISVLSMSFKTTNADSVADLSTRITYGPDDADVFEGGAVVISDVTVDGLIRKPALAQLPLRMINASNVYGAALNIYNDTANYDSLPVTGGLTTAVIVAGGTGWAVNDTFTINDATCKVLTVSTGAIATFQILTPGTGSYKTPTQTSVPIAATNASGTGVDATFDVTGVDWSANPLTVKVQVVYTVL